MNFIKINIDMFVSLIISFAIYILFLSSLSEAKLVLKKKAFYKIVIIFT